jgi:glycosyltransferase involved in cell wall biosynthesis
MRILLAHSNLIGYGGGEKVFLEVTKHLSKNKHDIDILTWEYDPEKTFEDFRKFDIRTLKFFGSPMSKFARWAAYKGDYELVNCHGFPSNFLAFRNDNVYWVNHSDHASRGYGNYLNSGPIHKRLYANSIGYFDRASARRMKKVIANSEFCADFIRNYYHVEPAIVNPGIYPSEFSTGKYEDYILLVCRVSPEKNVELAIKMMEHMNRNLKLIIVGGWVNENYINSLKYDKQRVEIRQHLEQRDVKKLYSNCLAVVQTALNEPFGIVPLEAMASGKPVIAPARGGFNETITDDTGFRLDPDPKLFAEKINFLYENKGIAKKMGKMGLKRAKEFDWKKKMRDMDKVLGL